MMNLDTIYQCFLQCTEVTIDSRSCKEGALFVALRGQNSNGNKYAAQALQNGCKYALVDDTSCIDSSDARYLVVEDSLETLQQLARLHRRTLGTKMLAITGTNGKTTTKELTSAVLSQQYNVLYTAGNYNNQLGVPLTLLRLRPAHDLAVIEMGASHPGDIALLCSIAEPDYGLITNVGKAHLEGFGSFEGVIRTKGELYDYLRSVGKTTIFLHQDSPYLKQIAHGLTPITYGTKIGSSVYATSFEGSPFLKFHWKKEDETHEYTVNTQLIGAYNLPNALAAITVGLFFHVDTKAICNALAAYQPQNNRSQLIKTAANTLIVDAYNANPSSMMVALQNFKAMRGERKMVILGDMLELGADSAKEHQAIVDFLGTCHFDSVVLVGKEFAATQHTYTNYEHVDQLKEAFATKKPANQLVLIKGSNGIHLSTLTDCL